MKWQTIAEHSSNPKYVCIHTRAYNIRYYRQATQHRSCRGNEREAQQATTAKRKGAATKVSYFTAVPPLPPIDIDNQQHCCLSLFAEALYVVVAVYSNLNSPIPRVRTIRQLLFRATALSTVVRRHVYTSEYESQFCLSTVRCLCPRRWWTRYNVGTVC